MRVLWVTLVCILVAGYAFASPDAGTAVFNFLKVGLGARAPGMGGAFTGVADDVTSIYWNPAGLTRVSGAEATAGYVKYMAGINSGFAAYARPLGPKSRLGVGVNSFYVGGLTKTDENNNELGEFGSAMLVPSVAYAADLGEEISVGATAKFVYQSIDIYNSYGAAVDLGCTYTPAEALYSFGLVVQNLGRQLKAFVTEKDILPITARIGGVYRHKEAPFVAGLDVGKSIDSGFFFSLGAEYWANPMLGIRFGYSSTGQELHSDSPSDIMGGFSFGLGLRWKQYGLDYALVPKVDLGLVNRLSVSVRM
ncbi:MAG: PorV/PorQ family protein [bacterium]